MTSPDSEESGPFYSTLPVDKEARLPPGTTLLDGRVEIVKELARGGMAIVYRALDHHRGGAEVAFKVVTDQANAEDTEARYRNEARLGNSLAGDPRFVAPLGVGCLDAPAGFEGRMFLMTELVAGRSLDRVIAHHGTGMPSDRVVELACGVARALISLHERGIIHRDIKPGNILLENEGQPDERVRIIDFGLSYATGDGWEPKSPDLTMEGHAPGTPIYMSPQQLVHERPTPAFDVYAFGATLYHLISGRPPYDGHALEGLVSRKCDPTRTPFSIGKMRPSTPAHLADLVDRCLAYAPSERPTVEEIVRVLDPEPVARGATAPSLRIVSDLKPSVVADGARPAGDVTRADLRRKAVPLPFVQQAEETGASEGGPQEWTNTEHTRLIPKETISAAARTVGFEPPRMPEVAAAPPAPVPTPDEQPRRRFGAVALFAVLGLALGGGLWGWYSSQEPNEVAESVEASSAPVLDGGEDAKPASEEQEAAPPEPVPPEVEPPSAAAEKPAAELDPPDPVKDDVIPDQPPPRAPKKKRPKSESPSPTPPAKSKPNCDGVVDEAQAAWKKQSWAKVVRLTASAKCWSEASDQRIRLRTQALLEQGQYDRCARTGAKSKQPRVLKWVSICRSKAGQGGEE